MAELKENVIEWHNGDSMISCTFNQRKYINKVRKMQSVHPESVPVFVENVDGSVFCRIPLKALKLYLLTNNGSDFSAADEDEEE